jgi:hypothetical protein
VVGAEDIRGDYGVARALRAKTTEKMAKVGKKKSNKKKLKCGPDHSSMQSVVQITCFGSH